MIKLRAVIYARYSSDNQRVESVDAQIRDCRKYAALHEYHIVSIYADEAISGKGSKTKSRVQYQRMLRDAAKDKFDVILIHAYDRIARNVAEHANLEMRMLDYNIRIISVTQDFGNSKEAKLMRTMMWGMSEYYIDNLSAETKKGHRETALKGMHNGGYAPFGYDIVNQKYIINPIEAAYVRKMFECARNRTGYTELIKEMDNAGIRGKRGRTIKYPQIYEILRNEKYTGVYLYSVDEDKKREDRRIKSNAIRVDGAVPQIITPELYKEVQEIMASHKAVRSNKYLCSGLVYCGHCGAKMHASTTHRKGYEYKIYSCSNHCGIGIVSASDIDDFAISYIRELLSENNQDKVMLELMRYMSAERNRVWEFNREIKRKIAQKQSQYDTYMTQLGSGVLPHDVVADIGSKMQELKQEMATLSEATPPQDFTVPQIKAWLDAIKNAPNEQAVHMLIERIDVTKDKENATTDIVAHSALTSVVDFTGCGGRI